MHHPAAAHHGPGPLKRTSAAIVHPHCASQGSISRALLCVSWQAYGRQPAIVPSERCPCLADSLEYVRWFASGVCRRTSGRPRRQSGSQRSRCAASAIMTISVRVSSPPLTPSDTGIRPAAARVNERRPLHRVPSETAGLPHLGTRRPFSACWFDRAGATDYCAAASSPKAGASSAPARTTTCRPRRGRDQRRRRLRLAEAEEALAPRLLASGRCGEGPRREPCSSVRPRAASGPA